MDPRWFMTGGTLMIFALFALVTAEKQLSRIDIWLDQHDSPQTAEANALRPLISCINRVDVPWRQDRRADAATVPVARHWSESAYPQAQRYDRTAILYDLCPPDIAFKAGLMATTQNLLPSITGYTGTLGKVIDNGIIDRLTLSETQRSSDWFKGYEADKSRQFLRASQTLRNELEQRERNLRPQQLQELERRHGQDLHWHLLNYMLLARTSVDQLSAAGQQQNLSPNLVATTRARLEQAWLAGEQQVQRQKQRRGNDQEAIEYLWRSLQQPVKTYQAALGQLEKDWHARAEPQVLSDDFWAVTQGYDILLAHYNRHADANF